MSADCAKRPPDGKDGMGLRDAFSSVFKRLDIDGDGFLSIQETVRGLQELDIAVPVEQASEIFALADADRDGLISLYEFEAFCFTKVFHLRSIYAGIDRNGDGRLTSADLRYGFRQSGLNVSDDQLRRIFGKLDANSNGTISFQEFCESLLLVPVINPRGVFEAWQQYVCIDDATSEYTVAKDINAWSGKQLAEALMSGVIAGAVSRTATAPLDRVKTMLQASTAGATSQNIAASFVNIYREGGLKAFFRGNGVNILKIGPETAAKFTAFDALKHILAKDPGNVTALERFEAGGLAGAAAQFAVYPLEIAKTRMSISPAGMYPSVLGCLQTVAATEGFTALYKGLGPSLAGIVPYAGIDLMTNSLLKDVVGGRCEKQGVEPGVLELLACGMMSSTCAMLVTYPLNLIRTRLQASGMPGSTKYTSAMQCLSHTLSTEGPRGLYRGLLPNLAKVLPATSISYAVYDMLSKR